MPSARSAEGELADLGVGLTYSAAIEPLLEARPDLVDVIEVEPQTLWIETPGPERYRFLPGVLDHVAALPGRKLVHSVGAPVGGTVRPEPQQLALLLRTVEQLGSPWVSDHLSFNSTPEHRTGFFLPPRQTPQGVAAVAAAIGEMSRALPVPLAVETGVSYLRPRSDEMEDGAFVAAVAQAAGCGILLDLHNVFANSLNGRQPLDAFLAQLPLESVWEIHMAGGVEMEGFWLDAHSGAIPEPLLAAARRVIPHLPNLRAIIFEIFPAFVPVVGTETVRAQLEALRELWEIRGREPLDRLPAPRSRVSWSARPEEEIPSPEAWERALGGLVVGRAPEDGLGRELADEAGVRLVRRLVEEFRASMIVNVLRLTARLIMLSLGQEALRTILREFWARTPPQLYASSEAQEFAGFLASLDLRVPRLDKVLEFERAVLSAVLDGEPRVVSFDFDPIPLLRALAEGRLPGEPGTPGHFEIEVTPDGPGAATGLDPSAVQQVYPFH